MLALLPVCQLVRAPKSVAQSWLFYRELTVPSIGVYRFWKIKSDILLLAREMVKADGECTCFTIPTDH